MQVDKAKIRYPSSEGLQKNVNNRPSVFTEGHRGEYYNIDIGKLVPFYKQSRECFDQKALNEMAETIKNHGIRQPLTIIADKLRSGLYEVVSGERRLRAAKIAKLDKVPCIIIHDYKAAAEIAIIENIQREDLHVLELAKAYKQLLEEEICFSHADIAKKVGVSKSAVTESLGLLKLPQNVKDKILFNKINNRDFFRELSKQKDAIAMVALLDAYGKERYRESHKTRNTGGARRKILLKAVLDGDQIHIDTQHMSRISKEKKRQLLEEISKALSLR